MTLTIEPVRTRRALREFIRLPRTLYRGMPGFVAPLDLERREMIDPKRNPFFTHGRAAYWIARRDGQPVGRISAQIDDIEGPETPKDLGQFGCLDAIDDREVVSALLRTAEAWLQERGRRYFRGPFVLSINGESGLLIDGHTSPPMILLPWHPPYLEAHLVAAGYRRAIKLLSYSLDLRTVTEPDLQRGAAEPRGRFSIRGLRFDDFAREMEIVRSIYNDGWARNWGFVPGTASDAKGLARSFKPFLLPEGAFFVCAENEPIAFALSIPNLFDISSDLDPAPGVVDSLRLLWRIKRRRYRSFRLVFVGGKTAWHGTGIGKLLIAEAIRRLRHYGAEELVCAWVLESNAALIAILQKFGFSAVASFGLYEK